MERNFAQIFSYYWIQVIMTKGRKRYIIKFMKPNKNAKYKFKNNFVIYNLGPTNNWNI